ncbi:hypothetical protein AB0J42_36165 [Nonomuraea sp. NPDC049649]
MLTHALITVLTVALTTAPLGDEDGIEVSAQTSGYIISGEQAPRVDDA